MAGKTTIYYNHNFYYDFSKIISADDRGLQFGDGCYEWIRVFHGHPFALSYHVDRLYRSMRLLGIRPVTAPDEFTEIVEVVIEETGVTEGYVKIIVTRGEGDHDFTIPSRNALRPNVLVYAKPIDLDAIAKLGTPEGTQAILNVIAGMNGQKPTAEQNAAAIGDGIGSATVGSIGLSRSGRGLMP